MRLQVVSWWYEKEQARAGRYNWTLCWERLYKDENGNILPEALGKFLYNEGNADYAGYVLFGEVLKETDKALQCRLKFWNLKKAGRYVTDAPVESRWTTWIPKSVLL